MSESLGREAPASVTGFAARVAARVREFLVGPNPTFLNLRDVTADVAWRDARRRYGSLHTIAELVFHIHFFFRVGLKVLRGEPLDEGDSDRHSFEAPAVESEGDWAGFVERALTDGEAFAAEVEALPDARLLETFLSEEYGDHFRNLLGTVEHGYYHLGQIVWLKKLLSEAPHDGVGRPRVGVGCIVIHEGRMLLVRNHRGFWSTPGGNLDLGEDPADCAVRETEEETGVPVKDPDFVAVTHDPMPARGTHYITIWMRAEIDGDESGEIEIRIGDEAEIAEAGWFETDALPDPRHVYFENLLSGRTMPKDRSALPVELR